jgi:hypothetical protein
MDAAKEFAIALENASREVIGLDIAKLTKTQLELYKSRADLEQIKWVELIKKRDEAIRTEAICTEAKVEALKDASKSIEIIKLEYEKSVSVFWRSTQYIVGLEDAIKTLRAAITGYRQK